MDNLFKPSEWLGSLWLAGRVLAGATLGLFLAVSVALPMAPSPQRIVSINLCADQWVIALADTHQIVGLSVLASDPSLSYFHQFAATSGIDSVSGNIEKILSLRPDLVLIGPYDRAYITEFLKQHSIPYFVVTIPHTLQDLQNQALELGVRLGQKARGEKLAKNLEDQMISLRQTAHRFRNILLMGHSAYSMAGTGALQDLLKEAGLKDIGAERAQMRGGFMTLEQIVTLNPTDLLLWETFEADEHKDMGSDLLHHLALRRWRIQVQTLPVATSLSLCMGPATIELMKTLSHALRHPRQINK